MNKNYILYHSDCFDVFNKMGDKSIDHVFTSPPYNRKRNDKYSHHTDVMNDYFGFLCRIVDESIRVCTGIVILNIQKNYYNSSDVYRLFGKYHDLIKEVFIWEKTNPMPAAGNAITNSYEFFIFFGDKAIKSNTTYTKNVISTSVNSNMPKNHKAVMKQDVSDFFIEKFTKKYDTIFDPFTGHGTTGVSCLKKGRFFIGSEKEIEYYNDSLNNLNSINHPIRG